MASAFIATLTAVLVVLLALQLVAAQQTWNEATVSRLLRNDNFVRRQIKCLLNEGSCDEYGFLIKLAAPEVLQRNCRSCNAQQILMARRVIHVLRRDYPTEWSRILGRYQG